MNMQRVLWAGALGLMVNVGAHAAPVSGSQWAGTSDDGGLGGIFAFLNSGGATPGQTDQWTVDWSPPNVVFTAEFGALGTYSNAASWDGETFIFPFGFPDTTSYGEVFVAPAEAEHLTHFDFLISSGGGAARLVISAFDRAGSHLLGPALFSAPVELAAGGGFVPTNLPALDVPLTPGGTYIAYLTVSAVPLPAGLPLLASACLAGALTLRRRRG